MREHMLEGAAREAIVVADLLRRGFEVFQAVGQFSCDLIAHKNGFLLRVEAKGPPHPGRIPKGVIGRACEKSGNPKCDRFDILATVVDGTVHYNRSKLFSGNTASSELVGDETPSRYARKP
jgi:hypothetical protein